MFSSDEEAEVVAEKPKRKGRSPARKKTITKAAASTPALFSDDEEDAGASSGR